MVAKLGTRKSLRSRGPGPRGRVGRRFAARKTVSPSGTSSGREGRSEAGVDEGFGERCVEDVRPIGTFHA